VNFVIIVAPFRRVKSKPAAELSSFIRNMRQPALGRKFIPILEESQTLNPDPPIGAPDEGLHFGKDLLRNTNRLSKELVNKAEQGGKVAVPNLDTVEETQVGHLPVEKPGAEFDKGTFIGVQRRSPWAKKEAKILAFSPNFNKRPREVNDPGRGSIELKLPSRIMNDHHFVVINKEAGEGTKHVQNFRNQNPFLPNTGEEPPDIISKGTNNGFGENQLEFPKERLETEHKKQGTERTPLSDSGGNRNTIPKLAPPRDFVVVSHIKPFVGVHDKLGNPNGF